MRFLLFKALFKDIQKGDYNVCVCMRHTSPFGDRCVTIVGLFNRILWCPCPKKNKAPLSRLFFLVLAICPLDHVRQTISI